MVDFALYHLDGSYLWEHNQPEKALPFYQRQYDLQSFLRSLGTDWVYDWEFADICHSLGLYFEKLGKLDDAISYFEQGLQMLNKDVKEFEAIKKAQLLSSIAGAHEQRKEFAEAIDHHKCAISIFEEHLGRNVADYIRARGNLACCLFEAREITKAIDLAKETHQLAVRHFRSGYQL